MTDDIDLPAICRVLGWTIVDEDDGFCYQPRSNEFCEWQDERVLCEEPGDAIVALEATGLPFRIDRLEDGTYEVQIQVWVDHDMPCGFGKVLTDAALEALTAWARAKEASNEAV